MIGTILFAKIDKNLHKWQQQATWNSFCCSISKKHLIMKKITLLLLSAVLLTACGNSRKQQNVVYHESISIFSTDSTSRDDSLDTQEDSRASKTNVGAVSSSSSQTTRRNHSSAHSNMRGFDPASEDDMDDNGMSRYFENNDDEGWD